MGHNTCKSMGRVLCVVRRCIPVTFMLTAHAQQSGIVGVFTDKVSANDLCVCFQNDQTDNNIPKLIGYVIV